MQGNANNVLRIPTAPDGSFRRCQECADSDRECTKCLSKGIRISKVTYACSDFKTPQEALEKKKKEATIRAAKVERMLNYILTAMCNTATATQMFLEDFCSFFEQTKEESKWRFERKKAANEICKNAERIESLHAQYFQADMNKVFTDHGKKDFDCEAYDNHDRDAYEVCRLLMLYIDRCWGDEAAANKVIACLEGMPTGNIFTDKDIERYRMR